MRTSGEDVVQAFRRAERADDTLIVKLRSLDPDATYRVRDVDASQPRNLSGAELAADGLTVTVPGRPGAAIVTYERL